MREEERECRRWVKNNQAICVRVVGHHARISEVRVGYLGGIYVLIIYALTRWCKGWQYRAIIERAKHSAVRVTYIHVTWAVSGHHWLLNQAKT
jgi:hypothetical protein